MTEHKPASVVALIPARGGSKGIPGKNLRSLAGKPLLAHTVLAALQASSIERVYVSSDSPAILAVAAEWGAQPLPRPAELARDDTPTDPVIDDCIRTLSLNTDDVIVLLQATSPLRRAEHIDAAMSVFREHPACQAVISVRPVDNKYLKTYFYQDDYLQPAFEAGAPYRRRQDLPDLYLANGAIYIFTVGQFLAGQQIPRAGLVPYRMTAEDSVDIDQTSDLLYAEQRMAAQTVENS